MSLYPPSRLDGHQVLQHAFDDTTQRLRTDTVVNTTITGDVEVIIKHEEDNILIYGLDDSNIHHAIKTDVGGILVNKVTDGEDVLQINTNGSLNTVSIDDENSEHVNVFNEIFSIPSGSSSNLIIYTVPIGQTFFLNRIDVSGENIALYNVFLDSNIIARKRTYFGSFLNLTFDFNQSNCVGFKITSGQEIIVEVLHNRPNSGNFECRIQGLLK